ncbi:hypothetical protein [Mycobacteroides abscessus]|uniref:hypothetical protein n=1 Tax=Mycobacteroides abscessus TaxID=36809 RepID=UPI0009A827CC|nr:hypothetical protein [Mycobacteroides abscessus]SLH89303.1 Uncharacterised protein [Mycobacteroides abscessus subsp. abscessus]
MQVRQDNVIYSNRISAARIDIELPEDAYSEHGPTELWARIAVDGPLSAEQLRIIAAACLDSADWMTAMTSHDPRALEEMNLRLPAGDMDAQYMARLMTRLGS